MQFVVHAVKLAAYEYGLLAQLSKKNIWQRYLRSNVDEGKQTSRNQGINKRGFIIDVIGDCTKSRLGDQCRAIVEVGGAGLNLTGSQLGDDDAQ